MAAIMLDRLRDVVFTRARGLGRCAEYVWHYFRKVDDMPDLVACLKYTNDPRFTKVR
jgi:hypothetical protein